MTKSGNKHPKMNISGYQMKSASFLAECELFDINVIQPVKPKRTSLNDSPRFNFAKCS